MGEMGMGLANRFFSSSESFDASATMANISYASTAPTVGQANSPVSLILITLYIDLHFPLPPNITSLPRSFIPLSIVISYLGSGPVARFSRLSLPAYLRNRRLSASGYQQLAGTWHHPIRAPLQSPILIDAHQISLPNLIISTILPSPTHSSSSNSLTPWRPH